MIIAFGIHDIISKRTKKLPKTKINIESVPKIKSIKQVKNPVTNKKVLEVSFEFITSYKPKIGQIKFQGVVVYSGDKLSQAEKSWKKNKKLPKEIDAEIKNFLFRKCLGLEISISENMQLPPPLMFPRISNQQKTKKPDLSYIG